VCLSALHYWFLSKWHGSQPLNPGKSDAIIIGTHQHSSSYSNLTSIDNAGSTIPLADHIKVLGVTLEKHLTFDDHVIAVCKSAYYHIRAMRHIRPAITEDMAKSVACALVGAQLDYANSVLFGVTNSSDILDQLHWLPIEWHIKFKIACITYKTVSTTLPAYLHSLLKHYVPSRTLCSSGSNLLFIPRVCTGFESRSFSVAAPIIWNSLLLDIRNSSTVSCFRHQFKTFFYKAAFGPP